MSDSEEDTDLSESEEDTEEEEEDEESEIGIALKLPHRATRANRYSTVIDNAQDEFWKHETWNEEHNDDEYVCSEGEENYKDIIDSDFDADESQDEKDPNEFVGIERPKVKIKKVYEDPSLKAKKIAKQRTGSVFRLKKIKPVEESTLEKISKIHNFTSSTHEKITTRKTTQKQSEKTALSSIHREIIKGKKKKKIKQKLELQISQYEPTQEEHLEQAKTVEESNKQSLIALQEWEEERKKYVEYKKQNYQGHYSVWISWASDRLIMSDATAKRAEQDDSFDIYNINNNPPSKYYKSDEAKDAPELLIFTDGKIPIDYQHSDATSHETQVHPKCVVTGNNAKYLDPLTNCFYENSSSFKILRQWYHDALDKQAINKLHEIEVLLKDRVNQLDKIL